MLLFTLASVAFDRFRTGRRLVVEAGLEFGDRFDRPQISADVRFRLPTLFRFGVARPVTR